MTSRERVQAALNHEAPDRVPVDLGATSVTGMHVAAVVKLREALGLDPPGTPVKVIDPYQMLGEIGLDLVEALGVDTVPLMRTKSKFGYPLDDWKPWTLFDGTPVLVPGGFNTEPEPSGDIVQYPGGDASVSPSGRMPKRGLYFDAIIRQEPIINERLDPRDNCEEFVVMSDEELAQLVQRAERLHAQTDKAIVVGIGGTGFGDIAHVPGVALKRPRGIRDMQEWYTSLITRPDYVSAVFERQCEIGLENIRRVYRAVGERAQVLFVTGTDFGAQSGPFIAPDVYRRLFKPFHKRINDWVHANTSWKTLIHTCGAVVPFMEDFIEAGFDILNPVQCSAAGMTPETLKKRFGIRIAFWGGGVDTQRTLPFATPADVRAEVRNRLRIFGRGGGYVFNAIHNIQAATPIENVRALFDAAREYGAYP